MKEAREQRFTYCSSYSGTPHPSMPLYAGIRIRRSHSGAVLIVNEKSSHIQFREAEQSRDIKPIARIVSLKNHTIMIFLSMNTHATFRILALRPDGFLTESYMHGPNEVTRLQAVWVLARL